MIGFASEPFSTKGQLKKKLTAGFGEGINKYIAMNPQDAKWHFKFRELINCGGVLAGFAVIALIALQTEGGWIITLIAAGIAYFVYMHVLANRTIGITCPNCRKHIATNTPWLCGFCPAKNQNGDEFPFINRCEHCGAEPKAYKCHHLDCGKLIFLTKDLQEENYATCYRPPAPPAPDETKEEISFQEKEKRKLEHQLRMTQLTAELNEAKKAVEPSKERAPHEIVEESFSRHNAFTMSAYDIARRQKADNAIKYKDDPEMLERANLSVDMWLRDRA